MTFNHLIWIKRNIHVCTGLRAWVWDTGHRKLVFEEFQACRSCPYGRPRAMRAWPKVSVTAPFSCL